MAHFLMAVPASYAQITAKHVQNRNLLAQLARITQSLQAENANVRDVLTRQDSVFLVYQMNTSITNLMFVDPALKTAQLAKI